MRSVSNLTSRRQQAAGAVNGNNANTESDASPDVTRHNGRLPLQSSSPQGHGSPQTHHRRLQTTSVPPNRVPSAVGLTVTAPLVSSVPSTSAPSAPPPVLLFSSGAPPLSGLAPSHLHDGIPLPLSADADTVIGEALSFRRRQRMLTLTSTNALLLATVATMVANGLYVIPWVRLVGGSTRSARAWWWASLPRPWFIPAAVNVRVSMIEMAIFGAVTAFAGLALYRVVVGLGDGVIETTTLVDVTIPSPAKYTHAVDDATSILIASPASATPPPSPPYHADADTGVGGDPSASEPAPIVPSRSFLPAPATTGLVSPDARAAGQRHRRLHGFTAPRAASAAGASGARNANHTAPTTTHDDTPRVNRQKRREAAVAWALWAVLQAAWLVPFMIGEYFAASNGQNLQSSSLNLSGGISPNARTLTGRTLMGCVLHSAVTVIGAMCVMELMAGVDAVAALCMGPALVWHVAIMCGNVVLYVMSQMGAADGAAAAAFKFA